MLYFVDAVLCLLEADIGTWQPIIDIPIFVVNDSFSQRRRGVCHLGSTERHVAHDRRSFHGMFQSELGSPASTVNRRTAEPQNRRTAQPPNRPTAQQHNSVRVSEQPAIFTEAYKPGKSRAC